MIDKVKIIIISLILGSLLFIWGIQTGKYLQKKEILEGKSLNSFVIVSPTSYATPTPLQGPGVYACDPFGICNNYGDEQRKSCPVTFADSQCLGQCKDQAKRCTR